MLNDTATVADESLFAATIILRVLEEIDSKFSIHTLLCMTLTPLSART